MISAPASETETGAAARKRADRASVRRGEPTERDQGKLSNVQRALSESRVERIDESVNVTAGRQT